MVWKLLIFPLGLSKELQIRAAMRVIRDGAPWLNGRTEMRKAGIPLCFTDFMIGEDTIPHRRERVDGKVSVIAIPLGGQRSPITLQNGVEKGLIRIGGPTLPFRSKLKRVP